MTQLNKTNVFIIDFMIHRFIEKALYSKLIINVKKAIITPEYYYHDKKQTHIFKSWTLKMGAVLCKTIIYHFWVYERSINKSLE